MEKLASAKLCCWNQAVTIPKPLVTVKGIIVKCRKSLREREA